MWKCLAALCSILLIGLPRAGAAAEWQPSRPMRIIVAYTPGGSTDLLARVMAERLSARLRQPVVVENRPGANGILGSEQVARAEPDGHTLLMATNGSHAISVGLYPRLSYDPTRDFAPITEVAVVPLVLVAPPSIGVRSVGDLLAYVRANPGRLSFGSAGIGASGHIAGEMLKRAAALDIEHVPFRGDGGAMPDLMAGRLTLMFANLPAAIELVRNGSLTALAVTGTGRAAALPELPTMREAGLADFQLEPWYGLMAPAGTPPAAIARLHAESVAVLAMPEVRTRIATMGADIVANTPDAFAAVIRDDIARSTRVIREAGIQQD